MNRIVLFLLLSLMGCIQPTTLGGDVYQCPARMKELLEDVKKELGKCQNNYQRLL